MAKNDLKFYLIPLLVIIIIFIIVLIIPSQFKKSPLQNSTPTPSITSTPIINFPQNHPSPTLIPVQNFTGANSTQELPPNIKNLGEEKTTLRRLTPLTLPFAIIKFDYANDLFLVQITEPKDTNKTQFDTWKEQNYPDITEDKFTFN